MFIKNLVRNRKKNLLKLSLLKSLQNQSLLYLQALTNISLLPTYFQGIVQVYLYYSHEFNNFLAKPGLFASFASNTTPSFTSFLQTQQSSSGLFGGFKPKGFLLSFSIINFFRWWWRKWRRRWRRWWWTTKIS